MRLRANKLIRSDFWTVLVLLLGVLLLLITFYPFFVLILKSFGVSNYQFSDINLKSYIGIFKDSQVVSALINTLSISIGITALTILIGASLAFLVTRTDFKHKKVVQTFVFLTFTIPAYVLGISWVEFFGRNGYLNRLFNSLGIEYTIKAYSMMAVVIVMSIHLYPLVFLALKTAFSRLDTSLEDAAILCGASRKRVFFTVTLPLVLPTIFSVGLFVFSRNMANFGVPALLIMPIYKETLTTMIYRELNNLNFSSSASISILLVVVSLVVFLVQQIVLRNKKYTTITSNTSKPKIIKLGKKGRLIGVVVLLFQLVTTLLPILVILVTSFMKRWGLALKAENFTLLNYKVLFSSALAQTALKNSLLFGLAASIVAIVISLFVAYITNFKHEKLGKTLEFFSSFPMVMPNIVMAIAAILAWNKGIFNFYGTSIIIILTYAALFLPISIKQISGLASSYDNSLEQAARVSGASSLRASKDILLPYISPAIRSSFVLCMLISFREIPIALMLHAPGTETVGVLLFSMRSNSSGLEATSTVASVVIFISLIGRLVLERNNKKKKRKHYEQGNN